MNLKALRKPKSWWQAGLLVLSVLLTGTLSAQVSGTVTDAENGEPLIGASVVIQGTSTGTITDFDGNFEINANPGDMLEISYTGYSMTEFLVGSQTTEITISLSQGVLINEVVVTGYATDERRKISGSVATIESRALQVAPSGNVEQQLQGRVAGVTVITNGQPGTASQVRVRGFGALGGNEPLYIVDGVPVGSTDFLNPNDIVSTTVLKDATAASIYGARAAGGVILYTTKRGERGKQKMTVTYDGMFGVTDPGTGPPIMNPQDHADWTWRAIQNAATQIGETPTFNHPQFGNGATPVLPDFLLVGTEAGVSGNVDLNAQEALYNTDFDAGPVYQVIRANKEGTDWYDAITRNALLNRHSLGFSGGGENSRYYVGVGMQEQEGILLHQQFSRYSFRINTEFDVLPFLRIGENIQGTYRSVRLLQGDADGQGSSDDENVILGASRMASIIPVYDEFGGYAGTTAPGFNNPPNPVAQLDGQRNNRNFQTQAFGNIYMELEPIEDLVFRTSFGGQHGLSNGRSYTRRTYENSENNSAFGYSQFSNFFTSWTWTNTLSYQRDFGVHTVKALAGQEALEQPTGYGINGFGLNPFSFTVPYVGLSTVTGGVPGGAPFNGVRFSSYFGKLDYDFNDKYILSAVIRRDGSSRFGRDVRFGTFPAFSAAWRISSEPFMEGMDWIDDLKLRGGYGIMGNSNNVDPNNQFSLYGTSIGASSYDISGSNSGAAEGFYRTRIGNPDAKWERAITSNIGLDALLFDGRIDFGIEFWRKETDDLLFRLPVTLQTGGFAAAPSRNVGEMLNEGIDFTLTVKGGNDFRYEITANGGFLNNEIVSLADDIEDLPGRSATYRGITPVLNQVGHPLSAFFGFDVVGIFNDQAEVDGAPAQDGAAPGRFRFADLNGFDENGNLTGQPDGVIDLADRTVIGNPVPDFTGGLTVKLGYQNFELEVYSFASIGNEIYNISKLFTDFYPLFPGAAISERVKDSWTFENRTGDIPLFENVSNFSTNTQSNSFYVEDGSYFRIQNLTLSYNLPAQLLDRANIERVKVFASVNNLLTITGYSGLDPSVGGAADTNFGIDLGNYPITRSWTFGLNLGF